MVFLAFHAAVMAFVTRVLAAMKACCMTLFASVVSPSWSHSSTTSLRLATSWSPSITCEVIFGATWFVAAGNQLTRFWRCFSIISLTHPPMLGWVWKILWEVSNGGSFGVSTWGRGFLKKSVAFGPCLRSFQKFSMTIKNNVKSWICFSLSKIWSCYIPFSEIKYLDWCKNYYQLRSGLNNNNKNKITFYLFFTSYTSSFSKIIRGGVPRLKILTSKNE